MENILKGIKTILFCDESKFYINDGDLEDEIYYFAVSVEKLQVPHVNREINRVVEKHRVKTKVFHSTKIFKETRPRSEFMRDLTQIIIDNKLHCFCHKLRFLAGFSKNVH